MPNPSIKIILVGNSGVGKTALIERYIDSHFTNVHVATIGVDMKFKETSVDGMKVDLRIWDPSGQEKFKSIVNTYYRDMHVFMFFVDITNPESLKTAQKLKTTIPTQFLAAGHSMLVVTKTDAANTDRKVSETELKELSEALNCNTRLAEELGCKPFYETSAKNNKGIEEAFAAAGKLGLRILDPTISFLTEEKTEEKYDFDEDEDDVKPVLTCGTKLAECLRHLFCCSNRRDKKPHDYHTLSTYTFSTNYKL